MTDHGKKPTLQNHGPCARCKTSTPTVVRSIPDLLAGHPATRRAQCGRCGMTRPRVRRSHAS